MRYNIGDNVTFKTVDCHGNTDMIHFGTVIDTEYNTWINKEIYVIITKYGNAVKLTEEEVD